MPLRVLWKKRKESQTKTSDDKESSDELWLWNSVKWYDGYPEVDLFMNFLNEINDDDFVFIRVGESYDDIDRRGCYWDNAYGLDLETNIVTNK